MLPVKPSVTIDVGSPGDQTVALDVTDEAKAPLPSESARSSNSAPVASTSSLPRERSSPFESRPTRGATTPNTARANAAPM